VRDFLLYAVCAPGLLCLFLPLVLTYEPITPYYGRVLEALAAKEVLR
jgi:hypothetical protein